MTGMNSLKGCEIAALTAMAAARAADDARWAYTLESTFEVRCPERAALVAEWRDRPGEFLARRATIEAGVLALVHRWSEGPQATDLYAEIRAFLSLFPEFCYHTTPLAVVDTSAGEVRSRLLFQRGPAWPVEGTEVGAREEQIVFCFDQNEACLKVEFWPYTEHITIVVAAPF